MVTMEVVKQVNIIVARALQLTVRPIFKVENTITWVIISLSKLIKFLEAAIG